MDLSNAIDLFWVIIAGILVFFMQAGFTLLEAGFTRLKNAANIAMKNIVDLLIGTISFWTIGYALMYGDSISGFIGTPAFFYTEPTDMHNLFYQTVFCATAATIVSGAIAERAKFTTYVVFTFIFTTFIYPIAGHWIWQADGWLTSLGFIDFAGSTAVHVVGGFAALAYAYILGPRIGKFNPDGSINNIPGHNLSLAVLGVFILWLGWFGFNAGSELAITGESANKVAMIIINTNLSAAAGGLAALLTTWLQHGKGQVSMTLNGTLAGLVGVTAGCAAVDPVGALCIGLLSGIVVVFSIDTLEKKFKIDDPVSAISVHGVVGILGTTLIGFFSTENGIFYGGDFQQLKIQVIGGIIVAIWSLVITGILVMMLENIAGVRVNRETENLGLDITEHNIDYDGKKTEEEKKATSNPLELIENEN